MPACGPDDSSRRSLQIFESLTAARFSVPGQRHEDAGVGRGLDEVGRGLLRDAGELLELEAHGLGVARVGRDAGADRGGAHVDLVEPLDDLGEAVVVLLQRVGEPDELLAEGHRHGILQLRAADLEHVRELAALRGEALGEQGVLLEQALHAEHHGELDRGRVDVVGRLAAVDVVDRVQVRVVAERRAPSPRGRRSR